MRGERRPSSGTISIGCKRTGVHAPRQAGLIGLAAAVPLKPCLIRVRTRRFEWVALTPIDQGRKSKRFEVANSGGGRCHSVVSFWLWIGLGRNTQRQARDAQDDGDIHRTDVAPADGEAAARC